MEVGNYQFDRLGRTMFQQLDAEEQAEVLKRLALLAEIPVAQWPAALATRLRGDPPLYLVRTKGGLRIIIQAVEGQKLEVMDINSLEIPESFTKIAAQNGLEHG